MKLNPREKKILLVVLLVLAAGAANWLALVPYLEYRDQLVLDAQSKSHQIEDAQHLLQKDRQLKAVLTSLEPTMNSDPSVAEGKLLNLIQTWEQQSGMASASFRRSRILDVHGFVRMSFNVSAVGPMTAAATLVYRMETAPMPMSIDELHVSPKQESADQLQVNAIVTILCHPLKSPTTSLAVR